MISEETLATALLVSRIVDNGTRPLKASEFWELPDSKSDLIGKSHKDLCEMGLEQELADRILKLCDRATSLTFELQKFEDSGIKTLTPDNENFPLRLLQRLGRKSPALFYAVGNLEHLNKPTMGIVGSRNVSEEGAEVAKNLAKTAVDMGYAVVSGGARGVDQLSMNAAYESNGNVIGVLADSLLKAVNNSDMRRSLLEDSNTVLITPYSPDAPFNVGNAMGRNKVIYATSFLTFVVATDEDKGGTWTGAIESLRNGFGKVAVWRGEGEGPGNAELELKGAHGFGDMGKIKQLLEEPEEMPPPLVDSSQEKLFK